VSEDTKDIMENETDVITLVDEDGAEHEFEIVDTAEIEGVNYVALVPILESPEDILDDSGELVILKVTEEDGEEFLDAIDDEDEFNKISAIFVERLEEEYDFEE